MTNGRNAFGMRIAAYCRVSTGNEEQLDSLKNQKEFFIRYATENKHDLIAIYADEGISGTSLKKRNEFQRMMYDASNRQFDVVVVKDISRFSRNTVDFLQAIRELKSYGINTVFVNSNMESFGESEFILTVFSALAQEESINISKRVKFGKRISTEKGCVPHSIFGYKRIDNYTLKIEPKEAEIVRKIFSLYVDEGLGCRRISAELNKSGCYTKTHGEWNPKGVLRILKNPIYCGEYVNGKYEVVDCISKKTVRLPPDRNVHHQRNEWAIVSRELFQKAQSILWKNGNRFAPNANFVQTEYGMKHTFSTLIKCAECGRSYTRKSYKGRSERVYWKCPTNDQLTSEKCSNRAVVDEAELLKIIATTIYSLIGKTEDFSKEIANSIISLSKKEIEHKKAKGYIEELKGKRVKIIDLYTAGIIDIDELTERIRSIDSDIASAEAINSDFSSQKASFELLCEKAASKLNSLFNIGEMKNHEMRKIVKTVSINADGDVKVYLV